MKLNVSKAFRKYWHTVFVMIILKNIFSLQLLF